MTRKERYAGILDYFRHNMQEARSELHFENPFQLIVAVVLSAQCTDKRVNLVTPALLEAYPTPSAMAQATFEELFPYVRSVSYPNSKTRHLIALAQKLVSDFGGEVPSDIDDLMSLAPEIMVMAATPAGLELYVRWHSFEGVHFDIWREVGDQFLTIQGDYHYVMAY